MKKNIKQEFNYLYGLNALRFENMFHFDVGFVQNKKPQIFGKVIFNGPATIIYWPSNDKTVVKLGPNDVYDAEKALLWAFFEHMHPGYTKSELRRQLEKWLPAKDDKINE